MGIARYLLRAGVFSRARANSSTVHSRPRCEQLESRWVPANVILDFDGGTIPASVGSPSPYFAVGGSQNVTWKGFVAHASSPAGSENRTEQILQIVAGVRQDYADFDVNVIWDDSGVNSPFFTAGSVIIMVSNNPSSDIAGLGPNTLGVAPLDLDNSSANVGLYFQPNVLNFTTNTADFINQTISTISHEAGHSLGLSHNDQLDSESRCIMMALDQNSGLDLWFTPEPSPHAGEGGLVYSEHARLTQNLGTAKSANILTTFERLSGQTITPDTAKIQLNSSDVGIFTGSVTLNSSSQPLQIDFGGDRDALRLDLKSGQTYAIRQRAAAGSSLDPIFSIFDLDGDFVAKGSQAIAGGASLLNFTPPVTGTYYIVAGSSYDQATSGVLGKRTLGAFNLEFTPTWYEIDSRTKTVRLTGDAGGNIMSAVNTPSGIRVSNGSNTVTLSTTLATSVEFIGLGGDDRYTVDLSGGPILVTVTDSDGATDRVTINGTTGSDLFTLSSTSIVTNDGAKILMTGVDDITVNGKESDDAFSIVAGVAAFHLNGENPTGVFPGDRLTVNTSGSAHTVLGTGTGYFDFIGAQRIEYSGLETVGTVEVPPPPPPPPTPPPSLIRTAFASGSGPGAAPVATLYANGRDFATYSVTAYDNFRGGVRVATGDINNDGFPDLITAAGPGGGPHIRVFNGKFPQQLSSAVGNIFAFGPGFIGGVNVATGDINGDGQVDIVAAADAGGGPHVKVFDGATGNVLASFFAYDAGFRGGVRVATGDVDGDGKADIITGAGAGGGPHVKVFDINAKVIKQFFAYPASFTGGVYVTAGDVTGDNRADIVTGAGEGGAALITVRDGLDLTLLSKFDAFPPVTGKFFTGDTVWTSGVHVAMVDTDNDGNPELYVMPGRGRAAIMRAYLLAPFAQIWNKAANDPTYLGGGVIGA